MNSRDQLDCLRRCVEEIESLRRANNEFAPLARAFLTIEKIVDLVPGPSRGMSEDIVWRLKKEIEKLDNEVFSKEKNDD